MKKTAKFFAAALFVAGGLAFASGKKDGGAGEGASRSFAGKSENAQKVLAFIQQSWDEGKTIAGQQDLTWVDGIDMAALVKRDTGKFPAIMGYDFMNYTQTSGGSGRSQTEEALAWWERGGIVTFCWHWRNPIAQGNSRSKDNFYSDGTSFRIPFVDGKLDEGSEAFSALKADLDVIAAELSRLRNAGCPVLWRPLHEASGGWFWWGASGKEAYLALYKFMHEYFTNEKGLNNLIWVWNAESAAWYPGDDWADIVAGDCYDLSQLDLKYSMLIDTGRGEKIVALSENGAIPARPWGRANWAYFVTWNDSGNPDDDSEDGDFWSNNRYNTPAHKKEIYSNENVITLESLPKWGK